MIRLNRHNIMHLKEAREKNKIARFIKENEKRYLVSHS
jgi:hypothetical protein